MTSTATSTQSFLPIDEIRDGVLLLKDGSLSMVAIVSSLNFALKSADEQQAIILQFQSFLNSLDFSVQIYVQSRRLDIKPYLSILETRVHEQTNDLIKIQTREYIQFIRSFTETTNIMQKKFFVVAPYLPPLVGKGSAGGGILSLFGDKKKLGEKEKLEAFEENRGQLEQRMSVVIQGLNRCGVRSILLGTEELVELFYKIFNPGEEGGAARVES